VIKFPEANEMKFRQIIFSCDISYFGDNSSFISSIKWADKGDMGTRGATNSSPISARTFLETSSISFLAYFLVLPKSLISIRYSGVRKQLPFSENNFYLLSFFPLRLDDSKAFKALVVVVANPTILDSSENLILSCFLKA